MKVHTYTCDACMTNAPVNEDWWLAWMTKSDGVPVFSLCVWAQDFADNKQMGHACSARCAAKLFENFVTNAKPVRVKAPAQIERIEGFGSLCWPFTPPADKYEEADEDDDD